MEKGRSAYKLPPPRRKLYQSQISRSGIIAPPKTRQLLSKINTIKFSKWEQVQNKSFLNWKDVLPLSRHALVAMLPLSSMLHFVII